MGGDWDRGAWDTRLVEITKLDVYGALRDCLVNGNPWEKTAFFQRVSRLIAEGNFKWGCKSRADMLRRLEVDVRGLYDSIRENGYQTQSELGTGRSEDEIRIGIARDGRLIMFDGRHRLIIARLLGLERVPVRVVVRHSEWLAFKASMIEYVNERLRGRVYQEIDHPDLADLPAKHGTERIELIHRGLKAISPRGKRVLDIGTHWGYMAQQLSEQGFQVTGIERDPESARFARKLAVATETDYEVWQGDLLDFPGGEYDVVLALSIFHHMIKTETRHERLRALLGRLKTDVLIFEPHDPVLSAEQMQDAYCNYAPDEFVEFVSRHAGLPRVVHLGTPEDRYRRPIFKLAR